MTKEEMIYAASVALAKNMDLSTLRYSDLLYGKEDCADEVWEYVTEGKENGTTWFKSTYSDVELHPAL